MAYADYVAACNADSPASTLEVDSGATPPFTGFKAKTYNGSSTFDAVSSPPAFSTTWSVEMWAKAQNQGNSGVFGLTPGYQLGLYIAPSDVEATLRYYIGGTICPYENDALMLNTWRHVVFVRNGTTFKIYVDGVERASATSSASIPSWSAAAFGRFNDQYYKGDLSQCRIYTTALSGTRVLAHYNAAISSGNPPINLTAAAAERTRTAPAASATVAPPGPINLASVVAVRALNAPAPGVSSPPRVLSSVAALWTRGAPAAALLGLQIRGPKHQIVTKVETHRLETATETHRIETGITVPEMEMA